ncbi:protein of unknown function [Streptoalloteichus hindustanus]|uniref:DUF397 domain-containing protein n=1 Tax=Streptoalloteichus hindustanus TaxID=2017 RepID=A0A1M5PHW5_STRHI|nr:protein of unknown function [Streptoalloteichus hindustanus]
MRNKGWYKSSHSAAASNNCVEVRITDEAVGVRDSKDRSGPALSFERKAWAAFVKRVRND